MCSIKEYYKLPLLNENRFVAVCLCVLGLCAQLDEAFSVVLSSHSTPPSRLGDHREVNITVRRNDDPFGVLEFVQSGLSVAINESKGEESHKGTFKHRQSMR